MAAPAMIRMDENLSPDQMQVVPGRKIHHKHADWFRRALGCVEEVLFGIQVPAITNVGSKHFRNRRELFRVIYLTRRLLNACDRSDLSEVVGIDAYEGHQPRVP
jgi:hypothetical protein